MKVPLSMTSSASALGVRTSAAGDDGCETAAEGSEDMADVRAVAMRVVWGQMRAGSMTSKVMAAAYCLPEY
jgi:hypothetical protein